MGLRLNNRGQPELFHQDMKNWLKFLRKQAEEADVFILKTANLSAPNVVAAFEKLLERI